MAKLKTNKSILSRLKVSSKGKLTRRAASQSHFNTKDGGNRGRLKHHVQSINKVDIRAFKQYLPYAKG